ncbi:Nicotinate-nucleotide--dimethylbenzimidazole phosphoribosyltransferase [Castellaniella denitrificans]
MVENFQAGGAAVNVLARQQGVELRIVDAGVKHDFGRRDGLVDRKIRAGSGDLAVEAAMTARECEQALRAGAELMAGADGEVVGFGEMGIANTTPAAALMHRLTARPSRTAWGRGRAWTPPASNARRG